MRKTKTLALCFLAVLSGTLLALYGCEPKEGSEFTTAPLGVNQPVSRERAAASTGAGTTISGSGEENVSSTFVFTGKVPPALGKPDNVEAILSFRAQMGNAPRTLSAAETEKILRSLGRLKLKSYDEAASKVEPVDGGGALVILHYKGDTTITYHVISSENISIQTGGEEQPTYYMDSSGTFQSLEDTLLSILQK